MRRPGFRMRLVLTLLLVLPRLAGAAEGPAVASRSGSHPGYGRVVVETASAAGYSVARDGARVVLSVETGELIAPPLAPQNVVAITGGVGRLELVLAPGADFRSMKLGNRIVLDVLDPTAPQPRSPPMRTAQAISPRADPPVDARPAPPPKASASGAGQSAASAAAPSPSAPVRPPPSNGRPTQAAARATAAPGPVASVPASLEPAGADRTAADAPASHGLTSQVPAAPAWPEVTGLPLTRPAVERQPDGVAAVATPAAAVPASPIAAEPSASPVALLAETGEPQEGVLLPMAPDTGAAAFRRGDRLLVVFDERRPIDLAALVADPGFATATIQLLPEATLLSLPAGDVLSLTREAAGWRVRLAVAPLGAITPSLRDGALVLPVGQPGRVVSVPDPISGGNLLVGTLRGGGELPPAAMRTARVSPFAEMPLSLRGVVVVPRSDRLVLRASGDSFILGGQGLDLGAAGGVADMPALLKAATLTRRFELPDRDPATLLRLLRERTESAAAAPARARTQARLQAAEAMVALGMGVEAASLLRVAAAEDAAGAQGADVQALAAVAALLAGRVGDSAALDDPAQDGSDEITLWRAVRLMRLQPDEAVSAAAAAPMFAATMPLIASYPSPLRDRLLPLAAEAMALGGEQAAARALASERADDPSLVFTRALLAEAGTPAAALAAYDSLATGRDRLMRVRAARRAIELRLAGHQIDAGEAARRMGALIYAWRGDQREIALRRRVAQLMEEAGKPREAMALLRETEAMAPDQLAALRAARAGVLARLAASATSVGALEFVAAAEENLDVAPQGPHESAFAETLAERLVSAEIPRRAVPLLERLMRGADGGAKAEFGARLAMVRLSDTDAEGAIAALDESDEPELGGALALRRARIGAQALAVLGRPAEAAARLAAFDDVESIRARARFAEAAQDWPGAMAALEGLVAALPGDGPLEGSQAELVLEAAAAAANDHNEAMLARLAPLAPRLDAARADLFRLLIEAPVGAVADLDRSEKELNLAKHALATMNSP